MGFPTANIRLDQKKESGVYSGMVFFDQKQYKAAIFIGKEAKILEAYILDFSGDLYENEIEVEVGEKIRDVQKFSSTQELIGQIKKDVEIIKNLK